MIVVGTAAHKSAALSSRLPLPSPLPLAPSPHPPRCSVEEHCYDDDAKLTAPEIHSYLGRISYQRRNKADPFFNKFLVAGVKDGKSYLGYLDQYATQFEENYSATGFGSQMALPLIRDRWRADMSEAEARRLMEDCMRVLWYRDCKALNRIQIGTVSAACPQQLCAWVCTFFLLRSVPPTCPSALSCVLSPLPCRSRLPARQ